MANPNSTIWGIPNTWVYSELAYGIEGAGARFAGYSKPMTANFGDGVTQGYRGSLLRAINVTHKMTLNEKLDRTICPCGQSPDVSPWGKIAIFNENSDLSMTPSRVITETSNINWFLCDRNQVGNNARFYSKIYNNGNNGGLAFQQFAPLASSPTNSYNSCMRLTPYVYYGLRSFVATIQVHLLPKNGTYDDIVTNSIWTNLDNFVNYKDTHDLIGLRLFFRNCTSINASTLILTYSTDTTQYGGQYSNQIAVIQDIPVNNNGSMVETEFLSLNMESGVSYRSGYIFDVCSVLNYPSSDNRRTNGVLPCWEYFDGQQIKRWKSSDNYDGVYWYTIPYSQATYDKIMKIAALFGCFFTPTTKYTFNYDMLDNDLYLPILDDKGVAHGQYTRGSDNANNNLYTKSSIRDIDYDPEAPPTPVDPNTYSNTTGFNSLTSGASMVERYVLDDSNVRQLLSDLWTITDDLTLDAGNVDFSELSEKILDEFLVTNPIDCIVSLKRYPFNIPHTFSSNKVSLKLGKSQVTSQGYPTHNIFDTVLFSGVDIYPKFGGSFLDYAPYTEYELYIPFCGTIKLNAGDILGHTLNCRLQIDLITGVCTAYILADELVIETMTGNCACEMQITGTDTSYMAGSITGAITQAKSTKLANITTSWSPLSIGGAISTVSNPWKQGQTAIGARYEREKAEYDLQHIQSPVHTMGSASPLTAWYQEFNARLIIYYPEGDAIDSSGGVSTTSPKLADLTDYAHTTGFACVMNGQVSDYHGLTVGNIDTSSIVGASEEERNMIKALFSQGVWLP